MQYIADLEVHSRFSRAVSNQMTIPNIARWAAVKGINIVGTGDFTHPIWFRELKSHLARAEPGLYQLAAAAQLDVRFLLTGEVSSIFSQGGRLYRIHTLLFAPCLEDAEKINKALGEGGANLMSDGRPIIGLSVRQVLETVLSVSPQTLVVPAHVWTPWFGYYGANGGFDSLLDGFGDLAKHIYAIETGMSSDPAMNWRIKELDGRTIISSGDAHSLEKLGREATVFEIPEGSLSYEAIYQAIIGSGSTGPVGSSSHPMSSAGSPAGTRRDPLRSRHPLKPAPQIAYTIEFYPEEGKYHYTGHRVCGVKHSPADTKRMGTVCSVCGKRLTVGVMHRVEELAERSEEELRIMRKKIPGTETDGVYSQAFPDRPPYVRLVPLMEILSEVHAVGFKSRKVLLEYERLTKSLGSEFDILLRAKPEDIEKVAVQKVAEGIGKVRSGDIFIDPGFDGVFGKVKIWDDEEEKESCQQTSLF